MKVRDLVEIQSEDSRSGRDLVEIRSEGSRSGRDSE